MPLQLVVANPTRRRRRKTVAKKATRRRRTTRTRKARSTRAAKRRPRAMARKTRRRSAPTRRRRRSRRSTFGGTPKAFVLDAAKQGVVGAAGFVAAEQIPDRLNIAQLQTGYGRIAGKALVGIAGGLLLSKFVGRKHGAAFAVGAMTNAGVSLYAAFRAGGLSGGGMAGPALGYSPVPLLGQGDGLEEFPEVAGVGDYMMDEPGID